MTSTFWSARNRPRQSLSRSYCSKTLVDPAKITEAIAVLRPLIDESTRTLGEQHASAIAVLYENYGPMLHRVATHIVRGRADAEDVVHDVFCRLPWLVGQYRNGGIGGWLKRITVSQALMHLRRRNSRREHLALDDMHVCPDVPTTEMNLFERDHGEELARALHQLSDPLRRVVILRFYLGYNHQEIGSALGITPNASEVRLCRALKQLRCALNGTPRASFAENDAPGERLTTAQAS